MPNLRNLGSEGRLELSALEVEPQRIYSGLMGLDSDELDNYDSDGAKPIQRRYCGDEDLDNG